MQCLIVAAGKGLRLRRHGNSKPLVELAGKPLIQYVIENAAKAGVAEFVVVTGYEASVLDAYLKNLAPRIGVSIRFVSATSSTSPNSMRCTVGSTVRRRRRAMRDSTASQQPWSGSRDAFATATITPATCWWGMT